MPPDVIKIKPLYLSEKVQRTRLDNYPVSHRYFPSETFPRTGKLSLERWEGTTNLRYPWGFQFGISLVDGEHLVFAGQVYRFDYDKNQLVRIPKHPLAIPPEKAVNLFTLGFNNGLRFYPQENYSGYVDLDGIRNQGVSDKPDARIFCRIIGGDFVTSSADAIKRYKTTGMAVGDVIETEEFSLKLEAIVPKDEKARIPGWVHFRRIPKPKPE